MPDASLALALRVTDVPLIVEPVAGDVSVTAGGVVSVWALRRTMLATDGTPLAPRTNSMYGPGGARLALLGMPTLSVPAPLVNDNGTKRWFMSIVWVTEPSPTSTTEPMLAASGVVTLMLAPYWAVAGAEVIVGRAPLNRYGGE